MFDDSIRERFANTKPIIYVGRVRRDGKVKVQYVYPLSGRRFTKIITQERLAEDRASEKYTIA